MQKPRHIIKQGTSTEGLQTKDLFIQLVRIVSERRNKKSYQRTAPLRAVTAYAISITPSEKQCVERLVLMDKLSQMVWWLRSRLWGWLAWAGEGNFISGFRQG
jgi:hypothetical protein